MLSQMACGCGFHTRCCIQARHCTVTEAWPCVTVNPVCGYLLYNTALPTYPYWAALGCTGPLRLLAMPAWDSSKLLIQTTGVKCICRAGWKHTALIKTTGAVYMQGGVEAHCINTDNRCAVHMYGGVEAHCINPDNRCAVYMQGGVEAHCIDPDNWCSDYVGWGGSTLH